MTINFFKKFYRAGKCHCNPSQDDGVLHKLPKIVIVGSPNSGKSALFNHLTGKYMIVSNYPGTTVEIARGTTVIHHKQYEVIDTPGMYSLMPITEEEAVSREFLLTEKPAVLLHVVPAQNIRLHLPFTLELMETGISIILVLNMMDEAEKLGMDFDIHGLGKKLDIPVVRTVCTTKQGLADLRGSINDIQPIKKNLFQYDDYLEHCIHTLGLCLSHTYPISKRALSLLLLREDPECADMVKKKEISFSKIRSHIREWKKDGKQSFDSSIVMCREKQAEALCSDIVCKKDTLRRYSFQEYANILTTNVWTGTVILMAVLYFGLYEFVGKFGAGTVVDFFNTFFIDVLNPFFIKIFQYVIPWPFLSELFVGEYGFFTLAIRYAFAIVLPIVGFFFLIFAIIEDSGYLPRLAMLLDRLMKIIGLSGRGVIPLVLGLGCSTMATMVTRTLPTKRERIIATLLLSLSIPCSAQLGVIMGVFQDKFSLLFIWFCVVISIFILVGIGLAKFFPGEKPLFFIEIPPLRLPQISNVFIKTYSRIVWYIREIIPLFLFASFLIWFFERIGIFSILITLLEYPVSFIGLPEESAVVYLLGFLRRDYGAAGLYDLHQAGMFTNNQLLIAVTVMTLFLPCIAQFLMNIKERGVKGGIGISVFVFFFSFTVGYIIYFGLQFFHITL